MRKKLSRTGLPPVEPAKLTPGMGVERPVKACEGARLTTCWRQLPKEEAMLRASCNTQKVNIEIRMRLNTRQQSTTCLIKPEILKVIVYELTTCQQ